MAQSDTPTGAKRLYLSTSNKKVAGVCGGIAEYFNVDATLIRLAWIALTILTGFIPGIIGYIIAAVIMPHREAT